ncbi:MAG: N-6 DNA methylase [Bacteroidetes bacterium]|nr:MAG: N-6 DNA methylase [Bacteroidota bacterium]
MITGTIKSQVDKVWEAFWTGGVANPLTVIEQITYLLFIRRLDEVQLLKERQANVAGLEIRDAIYEKGQESLRWSHFKNKDPDVMYQLFTKQEGVFEFMKSVGASGSVFGEHMKGATFMIPTPKLLDQVVQMIDGIDMVDRDTKGDLYEYLLSKIASAGKNGQFRTPRHIIKLMVEMMEPKADDTICDPSCGTAGFLVAASDYFHKPENKGLFNDKTFRKHYDKGMFSGIEFDATMLRIGAMNMQLHGMEHPTLIAKDALGEGNANIKEEYSLILANPPFKGSLDYDGVDSTLLTMVKTKKTELLFLALMLRMMKKGGRAAVIVPDGVLFGSSKAHKQIRTELVDNQKLDAIISMPSGVFKPYAGVSTAILIFTKTDGGGTDDVWFYDMQADGYSLDDKRNEVKENDIPDILTRWKARDTEAKRKRTDTSFLVPKAEIVEHEYDLSINRYKEIVYEEVVYDAPEVILSNIKKLDQERNDALSLLEKLLK